MTYSKPNPALIDEIIPTPKTVKEDLCGKTFKRLTVLGYWGKSYWVCKCSCGNIIKVQTSHLRSGASGSCGCLNKEINSKQFFKHGKPHLYKLYRYMKTRCNNPNAFRYKYYGGRGISICEEWQNSYDTFAEWSIQNGYKEGYSLDRIDPDGNYEPFNCRWVPKEEQPRNRRTNIKVTYKGRTEILADWCKILNRSHATLKYHIDKYGDLTRFIEEVLPQTGEIYEHIYN